MGEAGGGGYSPPGDRAGGGRGGLKKGKVERAQAGYKLGEALRFLVLPFEEIG